MNNQDDSIAIYLACRCYLYELLQHIFGHEPTVELVEIITSDHTQDVLRLFLDEDDIHFKAYLDLLYQLKGSITVETEKTIDQLISEYTFLFLGPNTLPAPPWESVYLSKERIIFQESTLLVRREYLEYQFLPVNYPHEADDHLALELDFMAHLARLTEKRFEKMDFGPLQKLLSDQIDFLKNHLLVWISDFGEQIQRSKTHNLYPQMARLTERILRIDFESLDELINLLYPKS